MSLKPECLELAVRFHDIYQPAQTFAYALSGRQFKQARMNLDALRVRIFEATAYGIFSEPEHDNIVGLVAGADDFFAQEDFVGAVRMGRWAASELIKLSHEKVCECQCGKE